MLREQARKLIASARQGVMAGTINWSSSESNYSNLNNTPLTSPHNRFTFDMNPTLNLDKPDLENRQAISSEASPNEDVNDSKGFYFVQRLVFATIFFI